MASYKEEYGDLLEFFESGKVDFIAHGCNCFHTMGSGIARQIKEKYPQAFEADKDTDYGDYNKLGSYSRYGGAYYFVSTYLNECSNKKRFKLANQILNCYTQFNYGNDRCYLDYEALTLCLRKINYEFKHKTIGLPQIGCGLAGGDWNKVREIIKKELKDIDVIVVMYNKEK